MAAEWPWRGRFGEAVFHLVFALTHASAVVHHLLGAVRALRGG